MKNRGTDRRVKRTRSLLHDALASLIHEKSYDDIVVKEILARADGGRSTFYSHFRDKDELLDSGIRDLLRPGQADLRPRAARVADHVLRFSPPLFEHIGRYRAAPIPIVRARMQVVHDRLGREVAALVAHDLAQCSPPHAGRQERERHIPAELLAEHVASTFVRVLNWWLGSPTPIPASEANELFRSLVLPTLARGVG